MRKIQLLIGKFAFSLVLSVVGLMLAGHAAMAAGKPLSIGELRRLYSGKTWFWSTGGGYFRRDGIFIAKSGAGKKRSRIKGGWGAYYGGRICFSGTWLARSGNGFDSTCFEHRRFGSTIYQRRLPSGNWYIWKRARPRKSDEYRKVVRGNYSNWYERYVAKARRKRARRRYKHRNRRVRRASIRRWQARKRARRGRRIARR